MHQNKVMPSCTFSPTLLFQITAECSFNYRNNPCELREKKLNKLPK